MENPVGKQPWMMNPSVHDVLSPIMKLSPKNNGSDLYDSYELQAVVKQLNRAIQGSKGHPLSLSPSFYHLNSPHYPQRLDHTRKQNAKRSKKISCSQSRKRDGDVEIKACAKGNKGRLQLWKKVKQTLVRCRIITD